MTNDQRLNKYIITPNYLHGIIVINDHIPNNVGAPLVGARTDDVYQRAQRPRPYKQKTMICLGIVLGV